MLKKLKYFLLTGIILSMSSLSFVGPQLHAQTLDPKGQACEALGVAGSGASGGNCTSAPGPDVNSTLKLGINVFSLIVGVAAVIMIIVGGLKYIISQGDSNNINSAKNTILYAIIGLVVVALSQVIVRFVLNKVG
jgi:cytochrome bd-type quinol oxidase subunit 2